MPTTSEIAARLEALGKQSDELHERYNALLEQRHADDPELTRLSEQIDSLHEEIDRLEIAETRQSLVENREFPPLDTDALPCEPGHYPWDYWQQWAMEDGISEDLAALGRAVIREAHQHNWPDQLKDECGWNDDGMDMLRIAKGNPEKAEVRWKYLLASDGEWHWDGGPRG